MIKVEIKTHSIQEFSFTKWSDDNKVVIHSPETDMFIVCSKETSQIFLETNSLNEALSKLEW